MNLKKFTEVGGSDIYINIDAVVAVRPWPTAVSIHVNVPGRQPGQIAEFSVTDDIQSVLAKMNTGSRV